MIKYLEKENDDNENVDSDEDSGSDSWSRTNVKQSVRRKRKVAAKIKTQPFVASNMTRVKEFDNKSTVWVSDAMGLVATVEELKSEHDQDLLITFDSPTLDGVTVSILPSLEKWKNRGTDESLEDVHTGVQCQERFISNRRLTEHVKNCHETGKQNSLNLPLDNSSSCQNCGADCGDWDELQHHLDVGCDVKAPLIEGIVQSGPDSPLQSQRTRLFMCDVCRMCFDTSSGLNRHRVVHARAAARASTSDVVAYKCAVCNANFSYAHTLANHSFEVHGAALGEPPEEETPQEEDKSLITKLEEELAEGYAPKNSELYDEPWQSETRESNAPDTPFKCGVCVTSFTDVDILCDHYSTCHLGEQQHYCECCSVGCSSEQQLEDHRSLHAAEELRGIPASTEDHPFVCPVCGRGFRRHRDITIHAKSHVNSVARPHHCQLCDSRFPMKSALDKHMLVHTGERPFHCDICLKSFRQNAALVRHKLWTHRLKNCNKCEMCGKTFFTLMLLRYHLESHGAAGKALQMKLPMAVMAAENVIEEEEAEAMNIEGDNPIQDKSKDLDDHDLSCGLCSLEFPSYVALLTHKLTHKLCASYKCDTCHRTFREKRYLRKHRATHRGTKPWRCDICNKAFATKLTLTRHFHVHLREALRPSGGEAEGTTDGLVSTLPREMQCQECLLEFAHKSHYVRHKLLHSGTPLFMCGLCDKLFVHKSDLVRHKVMHSFMFSCELCGRNFHKRSLYLLHRASHVEERPYKCTCGKSFSSRSNLSVHQRVHTGEKPYACDICQYRCSQGGRMAKHKLMHTGARPHMCSVCVKSFSTSESLRTHMRVHTGERPFKCGNCGKTFVNNSSLNAHMHDHVLEEMYKCDTCHHKFRKERHLLKHVLYHQLPADAAVQMFLCEVCGRVFDKKKYLYTHTITHNRNRNFDCLVCSKALASRIALRNHMLLHTTTTSPLPSVPDRMGHRCAICTREFRSLAILHRHEQQMHSAAPLYLANEHLNEDIRDNGECAIEFASVHDEFDDNTDGIDLMDEEMNEEEDRRLMNENSGPTPAELYVFEGEEEVDDDREVQQGNDAEITTRRYMIGEASDIEKAPKSDPVAQVQYDEADVGKLNALISPEQLKASPKSYSEQAEHGQDASEITESNHLQLESLEEGDEDMRYVDVQENFLPPMTVDKPHICADCGKTFAKRQYLTKHRYRHREVLAHACELCGKRFAQRFEVAVHAMRHTGEKPFACTVCNKPFRSKVNLAAHTMRHTGDFPFLCAVCLRGFPTRLQLERHVGAHVGAHAFQCAACNKGFTQRSQLVKHWAKDHKEEAEEIGVIEAEMTWPDEGETEHTQEETELAVAHIERQLLRVHENSSVGSGVDILSESFFAPPKVLQSILRTRESGQLDGGRGEPVLDEMELLEEVEGHSKVFLESS